LCATLPTGRRTSIIENIELALNHSRIVALLQSGAPLPSVLDLFQGFWVSALVRYLEHQSTASGDETAVVLYDFPETLEYKVIRSDLGARCAVHEVLWLHRNIATAFMAIDSENRGRE